MAKPRETPRLRRARESLSRSVSKRICAEIDLGRAKDAGYEAAREMGVFLTQFENAVRDDERIKLEKRAAALAPKAAKK